MVNRHQQDTDVPGLATGVHAGAGKNPGNGKNNRIIHGRSRAHQVP